MKCISMSLITVQFHTVKINIYFKLGVNLNSAQNEVSVLGICQHIRSSCELFVVILKSSAVSRTWLVSQAPPYELSLLFPE